MRCMAATCKMSKCVQNTVLSENLKHKEEFAERPVVVVVARRSVASSEVERPT